MKTIQEIFNSEPQGKDKNNFGVEIELENIHLPPNAVGWRQEADGSLRDNGREYVFRQPETLERSGELLTGLHATFEELRIKPKASNLTSTHIHIDVRDLNVTQFLDFVACLMVVEPDLMNASGKDRQNNYFALSTSESDHRLNDLMKVKCADSLKAFVHRQRVRDNRYSGINFNSLGDYGSLEIRYLSGQADPRNVMPWLEFYNRLKILAKAGIDFQWLFQSISERGLQDVQNTFAPHFPITQDGILEGLRNAQDFVFPLDYEELPFPDNGDGLADFYD